MSPIKPKRTRREISSKFLVEFLLQIGFYASVTVRQDFDAQKYILVGASKTDPNDFQYLDVSALSTIYLIEKVPELTTQTLFHIEDFESSKFISLIGEDTIISQIGPPSLAQSNDSKSSK